MKKVVIKVVFFIGIYSILLAGMDILSMVPPANRVIAKITNSSIDRTGSAEIEPRISWVQEQDATQYLIVGDSVGNQLFFGLRENNSEYCIATCNQAVTMAGQYILISEYIKNHESVEGIYMFMVPQTLGSDINTKLSYSYFVMPFIKNGYQDYLEDTTKDKLKETFGTFFLQPMIIKAIDFSCVNRKIYLNLMNEKKEQKTGKSEISDITEVYLRKIDSLCRERDIKFWLLPAPVEDTLDSHQQIEDIRTEFEKRELDQIFPDFFGNIQYYPEKEFGDHTHFAGIYAERSCLNEKIENMINKDNRLRNLRETYENVK